MTATDFETARAAIEEAFENRAALSPQNAPPALARAVDAALAGLDAGLLRVAAPDDTAARGWRVNEWLKKAVLLSFRLSANRVFEGAHTRYYDKVGLKFENFCDAQFEAAGARVVPPATVRRGAHIAANVVLMPSFVNIGAFVGEGTMVDTWATVGSCAQIGRNVHLSGGVGIGGVLEPLQANPTIIEDDCFVGARSEIVEGVVVGRGAVISMGVFIGQSTRIYNRESGEITRGYVPPGAVVVPGTLPAPDGKYALACAVIVKQVDQKTRAKTALNDLLRAD